MKAPYFSMELLPLLMSIPVKFLMAISGESVNEAMEAMLDTMERDLGSRKNFIFARWKIHFHMLYVYIWDYT